MQPRPSLSDVTDSVSNASLSALIKSLGALVFVLMGIVLLSLILMWESLQVLRSIDQNLNDHVEMPSEVIVVEEE